MQGMKLKGVPSGSLRINEIIEVGAIKNPQIVSGLKGEYYAHVSQGIGHGGIYRDTLPTLLTTSIVFDYARFCILVGLEHFASLGMPAEFDYSMFRSESEMRVQAGEAMSCPSVASVAVAYWANPYGPWWAKSRVRNENAKPAKIRRSNTKR